MRRAALLLTALAAAAAHADALLDQALASGGAYSANDWAYVSTMKVNAGGGNVVGDAWKRVTSQESGAQPTREVRITTYDPSKPSGHQTVIVSDTGQTASKGTIVRSEDNDQLPNYADMRQIVKPDAIKVGDTALTATYSFKTPLKDIRRIGSADLDIDTDTAILLSGTAVVQKTGVGAPYVKSVVVYLPTGTRGRGNAAAKIKQLSMGFRFAPDPQKGTQLLRAFGFDSEFQALGLVSVGASFLNRIDGYRFVGQK